MRVRRPHLQPSSAAKADEPVFQRRLVSNREAAAYWIARFSRAMTAAMERLVIPGRCEASNPESRDSPMCNCTSEVHVFDAPRNDVSNKDDYNDSGAVAASSQILVASSTSGRTSWRTRA